MDKINSSEWNETLWDMGHFWDIKPPYRAMSSYGNFQDMVSLTFIYAEKERLQISESFFYETSGTIRRKKTINWLFSYNIG